MFEEQLKELREITNTQRDSDLCRALGLGRTTISTWRSRGKIPEHVLEKARAGGFEHKSVSVRLYDVAASAGAGELVDYEPNRLIELGETLKAVLGITNPQRASMLNMRGDSMAPTLADGSLIAIETMDSFANDGIYVFTWDNELFIKRLQRIKEGVMVISDNKNYREWEITRDEMRDRVFKIHGRVTGCCQRL